MNCSLSPTLVFRNSASSIVCAWTMTLDRLVYPPHCPASNCLYFTTYPLLSSSCFSSSYGETCVSLPVSLSYIGIFCNTSSTFSAISSGVLHAAALRSCTGKYLLRGSAHPLRCPALENAGHGLPDKVTNDPLMCCDCTSSQLCIALTPYLFHSARCCASPLSHTHPMLNPASTAPASPPPAPVNRSDAVGITYSAMLVA